MPISMDQGPNLPPDMVPTSVNQQDTPAPMGERGEIIRRAMLVEKTLITFGSFSPQMGALINAFIPNFRRALIQSLPEENNQMPSPQGNLMGGY